MAAEDNFTKKEIIKSGVLYSGSVLVSRVIAAIKGFIIIYFLTVYQYGVFKLIFSLVGMFQSFIISGLDGVVRNDTALLLKNRKDDQAAQLFFEFFFLKLAIALMVWAALWVFIVFFTAGRYEANFIFLLKIASTTVMLNFLSNFLSLHFDTVGAMGKLSKINSVLEIAKLIITVAFFLILGANIETMVLSVVSILVLTNLVYLVATYRELWVWWLRFRFRWPRDIFSLAGAHGKWSVMSNLLSSFVANARNYIIKILLSTEAVAIWSVASQMMGSLYALLPSDKILAVFLPYKIKFDDLRTAPYRLYVKYLSALYWCLLVVGLFGGTILINLFFPAYRLSLPLFYIMTSILIFAGINDFAVAYLYTLHQQKILFMRTVQKSLLTVIFMVLFVKWFGYLGLGLEYAVTTMTLMITSYFSLVKIHPELGLRWIDFKFTKEELSGFQARLKEVAGRIKSRLT